MILRFSPWLLVAASWLVAGWWYPNAPARVPTHWNLYGQPDAWSDKPFGVLLLPATMTAIQLLFLVIPRIDPGRANYAKMRGAYGVTQVAIQGMLLVLYCAMAFSLDVGRVAPVATGVLLATLGAVLGKVRPNYMFGVRTPWTLASKRAWTSTHRIGGWGFLLLGIAVTIVALLSPPSAYMVMLVGVITLTLGLAVWSWKVWRDDPDKLPPGGATPV